MALVNPFPFEGLISRASRRWERWTGMLVAGLRCLTVTVPEHGGLSVEYGPTDTRISLTRPIPSHGWAFVGAGGIAARDPDTGEVFEAEATLHYREYDPDTGKKYLRLGSETATLLNEMDAPVPANVMAYYTEEGGELIVRGWVCAGDE